MDIPIETEAALRAGGAALLAELAMLCEMPQVFVTEKTVFDRAHPPGSKAQQRGAQFKLRCCTGPPLQKKCNDLAGEKACPTPLEALRHLREQVQREHGSETCLAKAREKLAAEGSSTAAPNEQPRDAFAEMLGRRLALQRAHSTLKQAEQSSEQCRARAADAQRQHAQVSCALLVLACPCMYLYQVFACGSYGSCYRTSRIRKPGAI